MEANSFHKLINTYTLRVRIHLSFYRRSALAIVLSLSFVYTFFIKIKTHFVNNVFTLRLHIASLALDMRSLARHVSSLARHLSCLASRILSVLGHQSKVFGRIPNMIGHQANVVGYLSNMIGRIPNMIGHLTNMIGRKYSEAYHISNVIGYMDRKLPNIDCFPSFIHKIFKNGNIKTPIFNKSSWSLKQLPSFQLKNKGAIFLFS